MTAPATAQDIYDLLIGDESISDALGSYTLPDGTTLPAIGVFASGDSLPSGTVTGGLEVVITETPNQAEQLLLSDEVLTNPTWRIYVVAWDAVGSLQAIRNRIITLLPGAPAARFRDVPGQSVANAQGEGLGVMDQVVIRWTNPTVVVEAGS